MVSAPLLDSLVEPDLTARSQPTLLAAEEPDLPKKQQDPRNEPVFVRHFALAFMGQREESGQSERRSAAFISYRTRRASASLRHARRATTHSSLVEWYSRCSPQSQRQTVQIIDLPLARSRVQQEVANVRTSNML
jgi:hypothetical protein